MKAQGGQEIEKKLIALGIANDNDMGWRPMEWEEGAHTTNTKWCSVDRVGPVNNLSFKMIQKGKTRKLAVRRDWGEIHGPKMDVLKTILNNPITETFFKSSLKPKNNFE